MTAAAEALARGELVILPTETVYGLACDAANATAVARLFEAKGRPRFNPLIAHVTGLDAAARLAALEEPALRLAGAFWPGPLTIVAPYIGETAVSGLARAGLDTIAMRAPAHPLAQAVLRQFGGPVAAPSANRSGRPSPTTVESATAETGAFAALALDGGPCPVGVESTVVSVLEGQVRLLRPGGVSRWELEKVAGPVLKGEGEAGRSPGRLARHYSPDLPMRLNAEAPEAGEAYLAFGPAPPQALQVFNLSPAGDLREAASRLFEGLLWAERSGAAALAVAPVPERGLGEAINDRLRRAAGFVG